MAAKKGDGLLMVFSEVPAEHDEEFNRWYNEEHIPERLAIPGVLNAARIRYAACSDRAHEPHLAEPARVGSGAGL